MTYEQKLHALNAIAGCELIMRKPGDWYVSQDVDVKNGCMLEGRYGNGEDPIIAIENHWQTLTDLRADEYLVVRTHDNSRIAVRWNGFMWESVKEKVAA